MADWPTGWRDVILRTSGIPKTQWALDVLSAWQKSTPVSVSGNNPLGLPVVKGVSTPAAFTQYAAFFTMTDFYAAIKALLATGPGKAVVSDLIGADDLAATWRDIHALGLPGNKTESDYPHLVLDMVASAYRDKLTKRQAGTVKTTGVVAAPANVHQAVAAQNVALHQAATMFGNTADAISHIVRSLG
jgi:hypothetical protein